MDDKTVDQSFPREMKGLILQGTEGADYDEMRHIHAQVYRAQGQKSSVSNPQSYLDQTLGGSLVGPPEQGELIQLLRNKETLINAGARVVPLPLSGRLKYPRQTGATTGGWLGENSQGNINQFKTGSILLTGKKAFAMVVMPSELIRFGSPASEAIVRADMTKTLALTLDKGLLDGSGSDDVPLGLATMGHILQLGRRGGVVQSESHREGFNYQFSVKVAEASAADILPPYVKRILARYRNAAVG